MAPSALSLFRRVALNRWTSGPVLRRRRAPSLLIPWIIAPPQARAIIDTIRRMEAACGIQGLRSGASPPMP